MKYTILIELETNLDEPIKVYDAIKLLGLSYFPFEQYSIQIANKTKQINKGNLNKAKPKK